MCAEFLQRSQGVRAKVHLVHFSLRVVFLKNYSCRGRVRTALSVLVRVLRTTSYYFSLDYNISLFLPLKNYPPPSRAGIVFLIKLIF